jgi:hypothetical protein
LYRPDIVGKPGLTSAGKGRFSAAIVWQGLPAFRSVEPMDRAATADKIAELIEPFNKKGITITAASTFAGDRGRVRHHHQHEPAGGNRNLRPADRRRDEAAGLTPADRVERIATRR